METQNSTSVSKLIPRINLSINGIYLMQVEFLYPFNFNHINIFVSIVHMFTRCTSKNMFAPSTDGGKFFLSN